jgi:NitT/TauT family transport system permease protein
VILVVAALLLWEALARAGVISAFYFPAPLKVADTLAELVASGELMAQLHITLARMLPGLLLGGIPGLALGLAMGWSARLRAVVDPLVAALHPVPKMAILPLVLVVFGIGETSKIVLVGLATFFPMVINAMAGVRQINPIHFEVAKNYGARPLQVLWRVVLPGSLPLTLSGLRLALNMAFHVTIALEIVAATTGLGALLWLSWEVLRVHLMLATLVVIAALGISFNLILQWLAGRLVPWQPDRPNRE